MIFYWGGDELGIVSCTMLYKDYNMGLYIGSMWLEYYLPCTSPMDPMGPMDSSGTKPRFPLKASNFSRVTSSQVIGTIHISSWNRTIPSEIEFQVPKIKNIIEDSSHCRCVSQVANA